MLLLDYLHYFYIGLNLLILLGESRRVERTYSSKENDFLSIRFLLSLVHTSSLFSFPCYLQTKWGIICIAINGNRLTEMLSLFGFINHGQFCLISRTNAFLTIIHFGTTTGSNHIIYHQHILSRIGHVPASPTEGMSRNLYLLRPH